MAETKALKKWQLRASKPKLFGATIYVEIEAKTDRELYKILDAIINAAFPPEIDSKIRKMSWDSDDIFEIE